jgi:transposase
VATPKELAAVAKATAKREAGDREWREAILAAHAAGLSYRAIAAHAGVSFARVAQIVTGR